MAISDLIERIRNCQENCTSKWQVMKKAPLVGCSETSKILIVSQDPSEIAWNNHVLFGEKNPTARQFANDIFGIDVDIFNEKHFAWIHVANCDTGKRSDGNDRRPNPRGPCAKLYLEPFLREIKPEFIVLVGTCAIEALFGKADKLTFLQASGEKWNNIPVQFIYHPSGRSRILNDPNIKVLQTKAINRIKGVTKKILLEEK